MADHQVPTPADGRLVTARFAIVTGATLVYFVSLGALLPSLPRYVEDELGGGGVAVGIVVGAFAVSAALFRPWAGRLGDVKGRRLLVSGGATIVGVTILCYSLVDGVVPLTILRFLTGIGEAAVFVGAATAVQDLAPDHRRGEAASYFSVALYTGMALGPAAGEHLADAFGFDAVWYSAGVIALLAALLGLGTPAHGGAPAAKPDRLLHRAAIGPGLVMLLGSVPFGGFSAFIALYGEEIGLTNVGGVFFLYAGTVLLIRVFGARLPDRLGWRRASSVALVSVGGAALLLALWGSLAAVWIAALAMAVGMSLLFPALFSAAMAGVPEDQRSQAVGTFSLFFDLANGFSAPLLGVVVALSSYRGAFAVAAGVAACGVFAQISLSRSRAAARADGAVELTALPDHGGHTMPLRVALLDDFQGAFAALHAWATLGPDIVVVPFRDHVVDPGALAARLEPFDAVIAIRERTALRREVLERLPRLRLVVTLGMANASIDLEAAHHLGIVVCGTATTFGVPATVELTWALILGLARGLHHEDAAIRAGGWQVGMGTVLAGKTLGLVGLGTFGALVAPIGRAFGMDVVAWSEQLTDERAAAVDVVRLDRATFFQSADVVSVHVKLSERSRGYVRRDDLRAMKPTALFVNTSRGAVVDEAALVEALQDGWIAGAALDVFVEEPLPPDHPLRHAPNTLLSPHIGWVSRESYRDHATQVAEDLRAFVAGAPVRVLTGTG